MYIGLFFSFLESYPKHPPQGLPPFNPHLLIDPSAPWDCWSSSPTHFREGHALSTTSGGGSAGVAFDCTVINYIPCLLSRSLVITRNIACAPLQPLGAQSQCSRRVRVSCMPGVFLESGCALEARCRQGPRAGEVLLQRQVQLGREVLTKRPTSYAAPALVVRCGRAARWRP